MLRRGLEPASVLWLNFRSDAQPTELSRPFLHKAVPERIGAALGSSRRDGLSVAHVPKRILRSLCKSPPMIIVLMMVIVLMVMMMKMTTTSITIITITITINNSIKRTRPPNAVIIIMIMVIKIQAIIHAVFHLT